MPGRLRAGLSRLTLIAVLAAGSAHGVVGGSGVDANTPDSPWAGVGALETGAGHYSGALIGRRHVLTAAHVVAGKQPGQVAFRLNLGSAEAPLPALAIHVHPAFRGTGNQLWHDDLAIVELARPAPTTAPVYPLHERPVAKGALITFVGYGQGGDGVTGASQGGSATVKRVGENRIEELLTRGGKPGRPDLFLFDFDAPESAGDGPGQGFKGPVGEGREATFAGGDSGAPVFVHSAGANRLLGVAAFVLGAPDSRSRYGSLAGGMLVPAYLDWIQSILDGHVQQAATALQSGPTP